MSTRPLCIYHHNCTDGFAAAWVVRRFFHGVVDFHPGRYGDDPPDVTGRDMFIVDFSYKRPVLLQMIKQAASLTILDHHLSAQEDLQDLPDAIARFDMERSGAMITWRYFFPSTEPPQLLRHIQDRDLWRWALEGSRDIVTGLFSHPYDFDVWDDLMQPAALPQLRNDGEAIDRKHRKDLAELLPKATRRMIIGGVDVPVANLPPTMASDAAGQLAIGEPFAAVYWDTAHSRQFSLRSSRTGADVSKIAEHYGGGGHRHAAGFSLQLAPPLYDALVSEVAA